MWINCRDSAVTLNPTLLPNDGDSLGSGPKKGIQMILKRHLKKENCDVYRTNNKDGNNVGYDLTKKAMKQ